jgi:hypothetical protein
MLIVEKVLRHSKRPVMQFELPNQAILTKIDVFGDIPQAHRSAQQSHVQGYNLLVYLLSHLQSASLSSSRTS